MIPSRLCLVLLLILAAGTARAELRLVGVVDGREYAVTGAAGRKLQGSDGERAIDLPATAAFRLEGDLAAQAREIYWAPPHSIEVWWKDRPGSRPGSKASVRIKMEIWKGSAGRKTKPAANSAWPVLTEAGGALVVAWVVDGQCSQIYVRPIGQVSPESTLSVNHAFDLTPDELRGTPAVMLWSAGRPLPPAPRFREPREEAAFLAIMTEDTNALAALLAAGLKPSLKQNAGHTLLHYAAARGTAAAVDALLRSGMPVNAADQSGLTPLAMAAYNGRDAVVETLLAAKARTSVVDTEKSTPLLQAMAGGHTAVARLLVVQGADVNATNDSQQSPFALAVDRGYVEMAELMFARKGLIDFKSEQTQRVLITQASLGHAEMVRFLLKHKVDPRPMFRGQRALTAAAAGGDAETVRLLLASGAEVDAPTADGLTPLMLACRRGAPEVAELLLAAGAKLETRAGDGRTALHAAVLGDRLELIARLLAGGADANARDAAGYSPLDHALLVGAREAAQMLHAGGAKVDLKSRQAAEVLEIAVVLDLVGVIRAALADGWPPDSSLRETWTALAVARVCESSGCEQLLVQAGARETTADQHVVVPPRELDRRPKALEVRFPNDPRDQDDWFPESQVVVQALLDEHGRLQFPKVQPPADRELAAVAMESLAGWRFQPVTRGGVPVCAWLKLPIEFPGSTALARDLAELEVLPRPRLQPAPVYPPQLAQTRQVGRVEVSFTIGKDGRTHSMRVRQSNHPGFEQPAMEAISKWLFVPGQLAGEPVDVRVTQLIVFEVN